MMTSASFSLVWCVRLSPLPIISVCQGPCILKVVGGGGRPVNAGEAPLIMRHPPEDLWSCFLHYLESEREKRGLFTIETVTLNLD